MMNKPERATLTEERINKIKEKYGYSSLSVFSPSFLEEYKGKITGFFPNPEQQEYLSTNMERITEFVIADRVSLGMSPFANSPETIQMDSEYVELTDDSFTIKPGYEYVETLFIHQLLHAASRQKGNNRNLTGVAEFIRDEEGKAIKGPNNKKNLALNEGLTRYFAEKISGSQVPNEVDPYAYNKNIVYILSDVLGEDILRSSYFGNGTALKETMNALAQDDGFYDDFNKRLDTIAKMESTIKRISAGKLKPVDPESLAKMKEVAEAQKTALMENLFSKVIIPQVQKIEVPEITNLQDYAQVQAHNLALQKRQEILRPILKKYPSILKSVAKYIPNHKFSDFVTDEVLVEIQKEIQTNGFNFDKVASAARRVNDSYAIGSRVRKDFLSAADEFYNANPGALEDRSTTMTPLLRRQLEKMVDVLDQLEAAAKQNPSEEMENSVRNYKEGFLRKHFQQIPNLDAEIEKIRDEKRQREKQGTQGAEVAPEIADILEAARKKGEETAHAYAGGEDPSKKTSEEETEVNKTRTFTLNDKFIIDNQTGAVIDQRNLSVSEKVENIVRATGNFDISAEPTFNKMSKNYSTSYVESLIPTLPKAKIDILKKAYGDDWQEEIQKAYEAGFNQGLNMALANARQKGLEERREIGEAVQSHTLPEEPKVAMDFEEVRYIEANFAVRKNEDGTTVVVDSVTEQPVLSERTTSATVFTEEWKKAAGERAFEPENEKIYRFVQVEATKALESSGEIQPEEVAADAEAMGEEYKVVTEQLFSSSNPTPVIANFFANQTPNAVRKEEPVVVEKEVQPEQTPQIEGGKHPVEMFHDVMGKLDTASKEEVQAQLDLFNASPVEIDGVTHHPYNDPVSAAKFNLRYFDLTGEYHPRFMEQAPIVIEGLMKDKDTLIQAGAYDQEYFDKLEKISSDIESRKIDNSPSLENTGKGK